MRKQYDIYYHISFKNNLHTNLIIPRIPQDIIESHLKDRIEILENINIPRFCMSETLEGCLNSVSHLLNLLDSYPHLTFYVYANKGEVNRFYNSNYLHDNRLVFDAYATQEIWVLEPIELELLGYFNIDKSYLKENIKVKLFNEDNNFHEHFSHYKFNKLPKILPV